MMDKIAELRRIVNAAIVKPTETVRLDCGTAAIPSKQMDEYAKAVSNPAVVRDLLYELAAKGEQESKDADKFNALWKERAELTEKEAIEIFEQGPYAEIRLPGECGHKIKRVIQRTVDKLAAAQEQLEQQSTQLTTYEQAITDVCKVINKVKCDINYPKRKELCLELNKLCRLLRESHCERNGGVSDEKMSKM